MTIAAMTLRFNSFVNGIVIIKKLKFDIVIK